MKLLLLLTSCLAVTAFSLQTKSRTVGGVKSMRTNAMMMKSTTALSAAEIPAGDISVVASEPAKKKFY